MFHGRWNGKNEVKYDYKIFGINIDREILYDRINKRVDQMVNTGLIEEVNKILKKYNEFPTAMQGLRLQRSGRIFEKQYI